MKNYVIISVCMVFIIIGFVNFIFLFVNDRGFMSIWISQPLSVFSGMYLILKYYFSSILYQKDAEFYLERAKKLKRSKKIYSRRYSGGIGDINFKGPSLKVTIYSQGLIVKPFIFMYPIAIFKEEVTNLIIKKRVILSKLIIEHKSETINFSIQLYYGGDSRLLKLLKELENK